MNGKKDVVVLTVAILALWAAAWCAIIAAVSNNIPIVVILAVLNAVTLIWLCFHARDRLKEIDEGLDDAVDNY